MIANERTSSCGKCPPCGLGTAYLSQPEAPSAFTSFLHAASTAPREWSAPTIFGTSRAAQARSSCASCLCRASKNGQSRNVLSGIRFAQNAAISVAFEHRLFFFDERVVGAAEVFRLHADRLRLGLGLDELVDRHVPLLVEHRL